jgi:thymidylate synthase (FAD)
MIEIINYTKNPLTTIGETASKCYNTILKDENHARRIAEHCIRSGHGRNLEFADITITVSGYSSRMVRELYTHIIGTSRTQSSTRYITYGDFEYVTPSNLKGEALEIYQNTMESIREGYKKLKDLGIENDITGYILPLGMTSTFNLKINARALEHMANLRMCNRALLEFRQFMKELKLEISKLDEEWKWIADNLMIPKCVKMGYCDEDYGCGLKPKKRDIKIITQEEYQELENYKFIHSNSDK